MRHTMMRVYIHVVFSTKKRRNTISPAFRQNLWKYMGGIARSERVTPILVNGMGDHAHLLLAIPSTITIAHCVQSIKGGSTLWVREHHYKLFEWQEGFAAFSVSASNVPQVYEYIHNQEEHHRRRSFAQEWNALLAKHGIDLAASA